MKRFWVFEQGEYDGGIGMDDLTEMFSTKKAAVKRAKDSPEWAAVFDSKTGKQTVYKYIGSTLKV